MQASAQDQLKIQQYLKGIEDQGQKHRDRLSQAANIGMGDPEKAMAIFDSVSGAPFRAAIKSLQDEPLNLWHAAKAYKDNFAGKPEEAPSWPDILTNAGMEDGKLKSVLSFLGSLAEPGIPGMGAIGSIKKAKDSGEVLDIVKLLRERGAAGMTKEAKIAELHGDTGKIIGVAEDTLPKEAARYSKETQAIKAKPYEEWSKASDVISDLHYADRRKLNDKELEKIKMLLPILEKRAKEFPGDGWAQYFNDAAKMLLDEKTAGTNKFKLPHGIDAESDVAKVADEIGVEIREGGKATKSKPGIHRTVGPDDNIEDVVQEALEEAENDGYSKIWLYKEDPGEVIKATEQMKARAGKGGPAEVIKTDLTQREIADLRERRSRMYDELPTAEKVRNSAEFKRIQSILRMSQRGADKKIIDSLEYAKKKLKKD